jgi:hypothetical protein
MTISLQKSMRAVLAVAAVASCSGVSWVAAGELPASAAATRADALKKITAAQEAATKLRAQARVPAPKSLTAEERENYLAQSALLNEIAQKVEDTAGGFGSTPGVSGPDLAAEMAAMNMSFLKLQQETQMEARKFQTLSNASKARHEIALKALRLIKG